MIKKILMLSLAIGLVTSCSNDDDGEKMSSLTLELDGLEALGNDYVYEGWLIVDGKPVSTGTFSSVTFPQSFNVNANQLAQATKFVLSIEPANDDDPAPSKTKILAGDFSGKMANVNSNIVGDFSSASGKYILATPTDGSGNNELSGVWFLDISVAPAVAGLSLPTLPDGWKYEGWAVMNGVPVSTGTFTDVADFDDNATTSNFKGDQGDGPSYPGEDFIKNAPAGLTFPTDLRGSTIVISVEPYPDNSAAPFTLKPLAHVVPSTATDHSTITMGAGPKASITGTVNR